MIEEGAVEEDGIVGCVDGNPCGGLVVSRFASESRRADVGQSAFLVVEDDEKIY